MRTSVPRGGLLCHVGGGAQRGDSSGDQGSTAAIIHLLLDSVLSARVLTLLNTTGRPPLFSCTGLQPCVNEGNIHRPHARPSVNLGVTLEITLSDIKSQRSPFLGLTKYGRPSGFVCVRMRNVYLDSLHSCDAAPGLKLDPKGQIPRTQPQ